MEIKLTIIIPSYNRGEYIEECLNSVFNQKTKYSYKILVADDCSTDNTLEILEKYKDKIILLKSDKNQKLYKNILRAYEITKTDYFCVLDPDDYWIDEFKIEEALDFLEKNKDFTIYTTNSYLQKGNSSEKIIHCSDWQNIEGTFKDLLNGKPLFSWTGSTIFRNVIFKNGLPDKMKNASKTELRSFRGDSFRSIIHLEKGKIFGSSKFSAVYRQTETGLWMGISEFSQLIFNARTCIDFYKYFDCKYDGILRYVNQHYLNIKNNFIQFVKNENDLERLKQNLEEFEKLESFINENKKIILKDKSLKYKFYFSLYEKMLKKLKKKGIV